MSIFSKILNSLLSKSNSYNYYKEFHDKYKMEEDYKRTLENKFNELNNKVNNEINLIKENDAINQRKIDDLTQFSNNNLAQINEKIDLLNDDVLINQYNIKQLKKLSENEFNVDKNNLKNKTIGYVLSAFPIHSETFILNEIKYLKEQGYNVVVFSFEESLYPVNFDFDVTHIHFNKTENTLDYLIKVVKSCEVDILHSHFVIWAKSCNYTYSLASTLNIPFTVFAHAFDIFVDENDKKNNIKEISLDPNCKAIFTLGDYHKNYLMERGVPEDKIVITKQATGYNIYPLQEKSNDIKEIVSISRLVEKKGIDTIIETAKLLENEDYTFSVYGYGPLEEELSNMIDEMGLKNISLKGKLSHNDVENVLLDADLLLSPCKIAENGDRDGFPTIIFEAMAYGTPVITTDVSVIPEIVKDGVNGFIVPSDNPEKLAEKIINVSKMSADNLYKIREQAQKDVEETSSVEKTVHTELKVWENAFN